MSKSSVFLVAVFGIPMAIMAAVLGPTAFDLVAHRRPPERFLIPDGYTGWARIDFQQKGAPPLPKEAARRILKLDSHGALQTSSEARPGHGRDEFFYYSGDRRIPLSTAGVCKGGMVWQIESLVDDHTSMPFTHFFVGTEDQFRRVFNPTGKDWPVCER